MPTEPNDPEAAERAFAIKAAFWPNAKDVPRLTIEAATSQSFEKLQKRNAGASPGQRRADSAALVERWVSGQALE